MGKPILKQLEERLTKGDLPMFVSEGTPEDKLQVIRHNEYLSFCYESLRKNDLPLTVFGFSFGDCDEHIITALSESSTPSIEVYLNPYAAQKHNFAIKVKTYLVAHQIEEHLGTGVDVKFWDTSKVSVWA
jgi:hypothetical protein